MSNQIGAVFIQRDFQLVAVGQPFYLQFLLLKLVRTGDDGGGKSATIGVFKLVGQAFGFRINFHANTGPPNRPGHIQILG